MYEGLRIRVYVHACVVYCVYVSKCVVCIVYTLICMYIGLNEREILSVLSVPRVWCAGRGMRHERIKYQVNELYVKLERR
jgi:hypothetical protein